MNTIGCYRSRETEKENNGGSPGSILGRFRENLLFFLHFTRHPVKIGVPLPCSRDIAETVRTELIAKGARRVIELGAGMGSLTWGILKALGHDTKLLCIESQPAFCRCLKRRFGERVEVVEADALHIQSIVRSTAWDKPDVIVSSIPLASTFREGYSGPEGRKGNCMLPPGHGSLHKVGRIDGYQQQAGGSGRTR